jgi:phage terminase Nu1 subunit (DNA packaging protein)
MKDEMSTDELAALFGCSAEAVRGLTRRHVLAKVGKSYPVAESVRRGMAHFREGAAARGGKSADGVAAQRARVLRLQGDRIERESAKEAGKLLDAAQVEEGMRVICTALRMLMMRVPGRIAGKSLALSRHDIGLIDEEVRDALNEVAESNVSDLEEVANGAKELGRHDQL